MRSSILAVIALLGTMTNEVDAISTQRRHQHHRHHSLIMDAAETPEDPKVLAVKEAIKKEQQQIAQAEIVAEKAEKVEKMKADLKKETTPPVLDEEEAKVEMSNNIKQLEQDALFNENKKKLADLDEQLSKDPNNIEAIQKKADSEVFIAKYNLEEKTKQAEASVQEEKIAEKKLVIAKLDADVNAFKEEEDKVAKQVEQQIKMETGTREAKTSVEEDPKMVKFEEGLKEMAAKEQEKEQKEVQKKLSMKKNQNPGVVASEMAAGQFDAAQDKYKEERALFEKMKAEEEAKAQALHTQKIRVLARANSDGEDYIASLPQHHFMTGHVYDKVCAKGGCYGSKPVLGPQ